MKAVLPVAGLGTRMLPATKEQPKEMLPIFSREGGSLVVKPLILNFATRPKLSE